MSKSRVNTSRLLPRPGVNRTALQWITALELKKKQTESHENKYRSLSSFRKRRWLSRNMFVVSVKMRKTLYRTASQRKNSTNNLELSAATRWGPNDSDNNQTVSVYFVCGGWSRATARPSLLCRFPSLAAPESESPVDLFKLTVGKY